MGTRRILLDLNAGLATWMRTKWCCAWFAGLMVLTTVGMLFYFDGSAMFAEAVLKAETTRDEEIVDWESIFSWAPINLQDCGILFKGEKLPELFQQKLKEFDGNISNAVRGTEGYSAMNPKKYQAWMTVAQAPFIKTVCETGFNYGHSSFGYLTINPRVKVYSFDIGVHPYARPQAGFIYKMYPGRLNVTWGDSRKTLPIFHQNHPDVKCDLIIVDGSHLGDVPGHDLNNFKLMANKNNIVIVDDYPNIKHGRDIGKAWERAKRLGIVTDIVNCMHEGGTVGFTIGRYLQ